MVGEAERDVGDDATIAGVDECAISFIGLIRLIAEFAEVEGFFGVFIPDGVISSRS